MGRFTIAVLISGIKLTLRKNSHNNQKKSHVSNWKIITVTLLICLGIILSAHFIILPYFAPEDSVQLNFTMKINSNGTRDEFEAKYFWSASELKEVDFGTYIDWKNNYAESLVISSGRFSDIIDERMYAIYIQWSNLTVFSNASWLLLIEIVAYMPEIELKIFGSSLSILDMYTMFKSSDITDSFRTDLESININELIIYADIALLIKSSVLEQFYYEKYGKIQYYSDMEYIIQNRFIGTIPITQV